MEDNLNRKIKRESKGWSEREGRTMYSSNNLQLPYLVGYGGVGREVHTNSASISVGLLIVVVWVKQFKDYFRCITESYMSKHIDIVKRSRAHIAEGARNMELKVEEPSNLRNRLELESSGRNARCLKTEVSI